MTIRGYGVLVSAMVMMLATGARAQPAADPAFPVLQAMKLRPEHNALTLLAACTRCSNGPAFCKSPLQSSPPTADVLAQWQAGQCSQAATPTVAATVTPETASLLGMTWQADVLNGVAAFLAERAKAELLASLVGHLQADLCDSKKLDFKHYLLATCALLGNADPYTTPVAWSALKAAIETDLRVLPQNLITHYISGDKAEPLIALAEAGVVLASGAEPLDTLNGLQAKYARIDSVSLCKQYPYACALRLLGEAVEVLAQPPTLALPGDTPSRERYVEIAARLLYEANNVAATAGAATRSNALAVTPALLDPKQLPALAPRLTAFSAALLTVNTVASDARAQPASDAGKAAATFNGYARSVSNAMSFDVVAAIDPAIAQAITGDDLKTALDHLELAFEHARAAEYVQSFAELNAALAAVDLTPPSWFTRYGGFLAEVAAAKTTDDAQKAFEAAAAPVGAWREKRGSGHSALTINAYVGVQGGGEWLSGNGVASSQSWQGGLFAPIGLEYSKGILEQSSIGLMLSVLDLGALVDFRDSANGTTSTTPNVGFRQVFSPGVYGLYGIGGVPLTIGGGVSLAPELRSVNVTGGTTQDVNALRLSVFFAVDITIFGL